MNTTLVGLYFLFGTILFFFWAYGFYAFFRDLKRSFIPKFRQYRRGRKRLQEDEDVGADDELDEDEKQLL